MGSVAHKGGNLIENLCYIFIIRTYVMPCGGQESSVGKNPDLQYSVIRLEPYCWQGVFLVR